VRLVLGLSLVGFAFCSFFSAAQTQSSQLTSSSDPQALALAAQSIAAMTGGNPVSDVTLTGSLSSVTEAGSQTGTVTLMAKGVTESRVDLVLPDLSVSEIRNGSSGLPLCATSVNGGSQQLSAAHNCWTSAGWFFPVLVGLGVTSDSSFVLSYIGQETRNQVPVQHLRLSRFVNKRDVAANVFNQRISSVDIFLDATSLLPAAFAFNTHPDSDATYDIPIAVAFSKYQPFNGIQIPTHIQKYVTGTLALDISVTAASLNSGLPDSTFSITGQSQ
jgi:hypothetical protein